MGRVWMSGGGGGADLDVITAGAGNVLSGKVIVDKDGNPLTGTMPNQGAKTANLNCGGSYTIPAGYHNGSGKVTADSLASQTDATATAAQILASQTAWVKGSKLTGTMPNQGAKTASLNCSGSYTIPAGYHNGSGKVTANSLASQTSANATAAQILASQTAWVNGTKITGTMTNRGTWNGSCGTNGSVTIPAGYHNGSGKVTNSQATLAGGTYTPGTSAQTISCSGKLMTGNIVIGAIPSKYVDSTAAVAFFENGSYGKLADLGAYYYSGKDGSKTAISASTLASSVQIVESSSNYYKTVVFRRSLPVAKFKRYVAVVQATGTVYKNLYMCIGTGMYGGTYRSVSVDGSSGAKTTLSITLPSSIDTSKKWGLNFSCVLGKACTSNIKLISLYAYAS